MAESNSRWPACARVPPFLPVPLRARADGWTPARRHRAGAVSFAHAWDTVIALRRGKSPRSVDFPKRKITPEELAEFADEYPFHLTLCRSRFVRAPRKPSVSALLRHVHRLDTLPSAMGGSGKVTTGRNSTLPPLLRQHPPGPGWQSAARSGYADGIGTGEQRE